MAGALTLLGIIALLILIVGEAWHDRQERARQDFFDNH